MGIHAYVFRKAGSDYDCTLGGWSSRFTEVCVINAEGPFDPDDKHPAVILVPHRTLRGAIHAISIADQSSGKWTMFGGNYLASSDSRFWQLCEKLGASLFHGAVAIHDRIEG